MSTTAIDTPVVAAASAATTSAAAVPAEAAPKRESQRSKKKKQREAAAAAATVATSGNGRSDDGAPPPKWPRRGSSAVEHGRAPSESSSETHACPLCASTTTSYWAYAGAKNYWRCGSCRLVFMLSRHRLGVDDEKARYDHHQNRPDDPGYRTFLSRIVKPLLPLLQQMHHQHGVATTLPAMAWPTLDENGTLPPPPATSAPAAAAATETKTEEKAEFPTVASSSSSSSLPVVKLRGMDFGCGPGPTLCLLISEGMPHDAVDIANFDIFYHNNQSLLTPIGQPLPTTDATAAASGASSSSGTVSTGYDFITCTETAEHFFNPLSELATMNNALKPGGLIALMTEYIPIRQDRFSGWSYVRDPTHVALFSPATMKWIANHFGWQLMYIDHKSIVIFRKPVTATATTSTTATAASSSA